MKTGSGKPSFDSIFLGEIRIDLLAQPDVFVQVVAGLMNSTTGRRFGSIQKRSGWSPNTLQKLAALLEAVEEDVAAEVFDGGSTSGGGGSIDTTTDGIPGL